MIERKRYFGKYRGIVDSISDPLGLGRIQARVPNITGDSAGGWGFFALPPVGSGVWIEFEQGDIDHPIWSGCYFLKADDLPSVLTHKSGQQVALATPGGLSIVLDDNKKSITLTTPAGQKIVISDNEIEIAAGPIANVKLANGKTAINGTALEVT
jgi:hypothetical protein